MCSFCTNRRATSPALFGLELSSSYAPYRPRNHRIVVMKPQSNIPMLQANGEPVPVGALSRAVLWSSGRNWPNLVVEEHRIFGADLDNVKFVAHVVTVNIGRSVTHDVAKCQRSRQVFKTGMSSLFPSHHPFFTRRRREESGFMDALFVALDPAFVIQTAADLEVDPDRVELLEQRGVNDPALLHIVMALREGLQDKRANDAMYGEFDEYVGQEAFKVQTGECVLDFSLPPLFAPMWLAVEA